MLEKVYFNTDDQVYVYIGGKGGNGVKNGTATAGYNGGGTGANDRSDDEADGGGGGATDIRYFGELEPVDLAWNTTNGLNSRIMVAAGGAGASDTFSGLPGGTLTGINTNIKGSTRSGLTMASQTSGNAFGIGQNGVYKRSNYPVAGAGGGYYGGLATDNGSTFDNRGGGGSSYVSGYIGSVAITSSTDRTPKSGCTNGTIDVTCSYHYSGKIFTNTEMINGNSVMPNPDGGTEIGHTGNGYAIITYIGKSI